jgi:hypothetical protein
MDFPWREGRSQLRSIRAAARVEAHEEAQIKRTKQSRMMQMTEWKGDNLTSIEMTISRQRGGGLSLSWSGDLPVHCNARLQQEWLMSPNEDTAAVRVQLGIR